MDRPEYEVRRAGVADVEALANAHRDSVLSIGRQYYEPPVVRDWSARIEPAMYLRAMARGEVFFIAIGSRDPERSVLGFSCHHFDGSDHGVGVYVRGTAARQGVGSALLRAAEADAIASGATSLIIDASLAAVDFYKGHGFDEIGRGDHRLWSGRPMPCVFMQKSLVAMR